MIFNLLGLVIQLGLPHKTEPVIVSQPVEKLFNKTKGALSNVHSVCTVKTKDALCTQCARSDLLKATLQPASHHLVETNVEYVEF